MIGFGLACAAVGFLAGMSIRGWVGDRREDAEFRQLLGRLTAADRRQLDMLEPYNEAGLAALEELKRRPPNPTK